MNEFDSFFGSVWRGEAPADALVDWILERVDDPKWLPMGTVDRPIAYHTFDLYIGKKTTAILQIGRDSMDYNVMWVTFVCWCIGYEQHQRFTRETMATDLGKWIKDQIDFLYYIGVSK